MRRIGLILVAICALAAAPPAMAEHGVEPTSLNMEHLANSPSPGTTNTDLAFWQELAFAGNYGGFRILRISNPNNPKVLSDFECNGPQGDVGVYGHGKRLLLFVSVDSRQLEGECSADDPTNTLGWEGVRIFDVSRPREPEFVKAVDTDCGSHTHTVVPDPDPEDRNRRVYIYVSSYPLTEHGTHDDPDEPNNAECTPAHGKISVIKVPLKRPEDAHVVSEPSVLPAVGCHDIGVYLQFEMAAAACLTEGQIWDISDPVNPVVEHHIVNPLVNIWHSGGFTWDGRVAIFGDEEGGAAATHGCGGTPPGATWFYEVANPTAPLGFFTQQRAQTPQGDLICTTHNYNTVPVSDTDRYLLTSAFYEAGTGIVDFSGVDEPPPLPLPLPQPVGTEIAYFDPEDADGRGDGDAWSSYWYKDYVYANDINRGVDVFQYTGGDIHGARSLHHLNPQTQEFFGPAR
jgi:hypothetical protein